MKPTLKDAIWLLLLIGALLYARQTRPRLAFVRSEIVVNDYLGMKEARQVYAAKQAQWQANLDTLQADYGRKKAEGKTPVALMMQLEQNARHYTQTMDQLMREEDAKMTQAVLDQINNFAEQYGQDHGYALILGTTQSGNILYGSDAMDLTKELLDALNTNYNPAAGAKK